MSTNKYLTSKMMTSKTIDSEEKKKQVELSLKLLTLKIPPGETFYSFNIDVLSAWIFENFNLKRRKNE